MKKLILLLLTLTLILGVFSSCQQKYFNIDNEASIFLDENTTAEISDTSETIETDEKHEAEEHVDTVETVDDTEPPFIERKYNYTLKKVGDKWYMIFDSYEHSQWNGQRREIYFRVDTLESFKSKIINNELDEGEKEHIVDNFERDDIGILIPNMDHILKPILPEGVSVYEVSMCQEEYIVSIVGGNLPSSINAIEGTMYVIDEAKFTERYNTSSKENIYVSEDGTKTIVLQQVKHPYVNEDHLYVKIGEDYACFNIRGLPENSNKDLIMSFGFEICE